MGRFNKSIRPYLFLGIFTLLGSLGVKAAPISTEFSAKIAYEGACEISVPGTVTFNNGDAILPSQIEALDAVTKQTFDLTLSGCRGIGVTPKIGVTGTSNSELGNDLFLDTADSTSVGYGILLQTLGNSDFQENANLATNKQIFAVKDWSVEKSLTRINGTLPMVVILTCGDCHKEGRIGGELTANITFDFQYD